MWRFPFAILAAGFLLFGGGKNGDLKVAATPDFQVHQPIRQGNLSIFPVSGGSVADASRYLTLDEGLAQGVVKVGELGALRGTGIMVRPADRLPDGRRVQIPQAPQIVDGARVNELAIQNLSDKPLLLLAGEVVSGGKQDRVVARDRIVAPHSEPVPLGVFCVEPGRWQGLSAQFSASKTMAHPLLRKEVTEARDQQKVWNEVARANTAMAETIVVQPAAPAGTGTGAGSGSGIGSGRGGGVVGGVAGGVSGGVFRAPSSYAQTVEAPAVQEKLNRDGRLFLKELPRGTSGVIVAVDGRIVWADLFASPALFERYRVKLLQSYLVQSIRTASPAAAAPALDEARDFLRHLSGRQTIEVEPDLYRLVRTEAAGLVTYELQALAPQAVTLHFARMAQ